MKRLQPIIGRWNTRGRSLGDPAIEIAGTDTYEWMLGGAFVLHRVEVRMGDDPVEVVEIIGGHDADTDTYPMRAFDTQGGLTTMTASLTDDAVWTFAGESERATLTVGDDGTTMRADWERTDDGETWVPWLEMRFTRES